MKTIELSSFTGVRNDLSPERFEKNDLQSCVNIELDETGKPFRRLGTTELDAVDSHSLWANDELAYVVRGGTLHQIMPDLSVVDLGIPILGSRVAYMRVANDVYFSDGLVNGIVGTNGYRPWGIAVPAQPVASIGPGDLREGKYLITMTYVRSTGQESGAAPIMSLDVGANQSIVLSAIPVSTDPLADTKNIYVSDCNGEVAYLIATLTNSETVATISQLPAARTLAVRTLRCGPPPPGQLVGQYSGCSYVAQNNYLWYSLPYEYELVHRAMNFIGFTSPLRTFAPVSDGIFVGSDDETVFLGGANPKEFSSRVVAPYGTVLGTETEVSGFQFGDPKGQNANPKAIPLWMSKRGLCAGMDNGFYTNLTGGRYALPEGVAKGASLLKTRGASPQLVTTLFS